MCKFEIKKLILFLVIYISLPYSTYATPFDWASGNRIVLTHDEDLNHQTISLKRGTIIDLRGGTLKNGTIICEDLTIVGYGHIVKDFPFIIGNGDLSISDVTFTDFSETGVFVEYSRSTCKKPSIKMINVKFDGSHKIERTLRCYMNKEIIEALIQIEDCEFSNVEEYVVQFASNCTGIITNCKIHDIGNSNKSHVSGLWLGYQDEYLACNMVISNNTIENILSPFSDIDDGREAHGLIVYGDNNRIENNFVRNIFSLDHTNGDPGMDTEGIYLKGNNNTIAYNYVENATGTGSDGAITVKHNRENSTSRNNSVHDNVISIRYSSGIVLYTDKSKVYNNTIKLHGNSVCGIETYCGNKVSVYNNVISGDRENLVKPAFSGGIVVSKCRNVALSDNRIEDVPTLLNFINNTGVIAVKDNLMTLLEDLNFGNNTKYTAGIFIQGGSGKIIIKGNTIFGKGTRGSQLLEFTGKEILKSVRIENNEFVFVDSPHQSTFMTYIIRKAPTKNVMVWGNKIDITGNYFSSTKVKSFKRNEMGKSGLEVMSNLDS